MDYSDPNCFTYPFQLTPSIHRDVYPYLDPTRAELSAQGKTVLITGVAGGVGKAVAETWAAAKAKTIIITSRNESALQEIALKLRSSSTNVIVCVGDISSEESVRGLFEKASSTGTIDVLVSCAGTLHTGKIGETDIKTWWSDYETNVRGLYLLFQGFLKHGGGKGTFISVGTGAAGITVPGMSGYSTSKLAEQKVIEFIHVEHPEIRAYTIDPGLPHTKMTLPDFVPYAKDDPALTGGLSLFLSTPKADWLKGQTIGAFWDLEEMETHKTAIQQGQLTQLGWLKAQLGKGGHPF